MADSTNRSVRILVVDADSASGQQICESLFNEGYSAEYSSSAARALLMARRSAPSVMIIDTDLDGCSGYEFAKTVRDEYPHHDFPVIFTSSREQGSEIIAESRSAGGMYFLRKPIDLSVLLELVDKSLWMPHLVRRHIDNQAHPDSPKTPRWMTSDSYTGYDL